MYHSVAPEPDTRWIDPANHVPAHTFEQQMHFLAAQRRVIALRDLAALLRQGRCPEAGTVVITFDDGYLDNLTVAAPLLNSLGLPATLFLPTAYVALGANQWIDRAFSAFEYRTRQELNWPGPEGKDRRLPLAPGTDVAYRQVCATLLAADPDRREALLARLESQLAPARTLPRLTMNWAEARRLVTEFKCFSIGGHTVNHTDLSSVDEAAARTEMRDCRRNITDRLGREPLHFSFPYGRSSARLRAIAAEEGFEAACGGGVDPLIRDQSALLAIKRVPAPRSMKSFQFLTSSANSGLLHRLMR